jgi:1,4-alpha-glucan branching enzyme
MRVPEDGNRALTYAELAKNLVEYVGKMGFTHVELMPPTEHPFLGSWGYQVTGFFAPTHRYGTPADFMKFVDAMHTNGIGVIIDWVPAHFPKDAFALAEFDGTRLYEHEDRRLGCHEGWGTLIFNYGRHEVRNFLIGSVLHWFERFHIDGIRVDAVASMLYLDYSRKDGEWLPNRYGGKENIEAMEFLREMNDVVHEMFPGAITIAEESTSFSGITRATKYHGIGFDFKWNMGWMHDTLSYFSQDPIYRKYHHNQLTFAMLYQYSENFIGSISHDEVVYGKRSMLYKMPGATIAEKARHLMALYSYMWMWPGKKSLFMGCEFGQSNEWQYDKGLDWHLLQYPDHRCVQNLVADLNKIYGKYNFFGEYDVDSRGFEWISCDDGDNSVIAFIRSDGGNKMVAVVCNFTPVERANYRIGVPKKCFWKEIFNGDCSAYGGMNRGNFGGKFADDIGSHGRPHSINLYLPPLCVLCFVPT